MKYPPKLIPSTNIIKYPQHIKPEMHSCCKHKNVIYIVDGCNGQIILFNPSTKKFTKKLKIPIIGVYSCCVSLHDDIHIFHGRSNKNHIIYSIKTNQIKTTNDETTTRNMGYVSILKYQDKIIRFGGYDYDYGQSMNRFCLSSKIKPDYNHQIKWEIKPENKLIKGMYGCGHVLYKNFIVTFGGYTKDGYTDNIFVLNMESNTKWMEIQHIRCPIKSRYEAALTPNNEVHLWSTHNDQGVYKHYSIPIGSILRDIGNNDNDTNYEEAKVDEYDDFGEKLNILKAEKASLKTVNEQLCIDKKKSRKCAKRIGGKIKKS